MFKASDTQPIMTGRRDGSQRALSLAAVVMAIKTAAKKNIARAVVTGCVSGA